MLARFKTGQVFGSLALAALLIALPCAAGAQTNQSGIDNAVNSSIANMTDRQLERAVTSALLNNMGTEIFQLDVDAYDGTVILNGGLDLPFQIDRATQIVNSLGVTNVINHMAVKEDLPAYRRWVEEGHY